MRDHPEPLQECALPGRSKADKNNQRFGCAVVTNLNAQFLRTYELRSFPFSYRVRLRPLNSKSQQAARQNENRRHYSSHDPNSLPESIAFADGFANTLLLVADRRPVTDNEVAGRRIPIVRFGVRFGRRRLRRDRA